MSARKTQHEARGAIVPNGVTMQSKGVFSRAKQGRSALDSTPRITPTRFLRLPDPPSTNQAHRISPSVSPSSSVETLRLVDLNCDQVENVISNLLGVLVAPRCRFDGRLLDLIENWQELVDLDIGIASVKAKLLYFHLLELKVSGVPCSLTQYNEIDASEPSAAPPPPPPPLTPPPPPPTGQSSTSPPGYSPQERTISYQSPPNKLQQGGGYTPGSNSSTGPTRLPQSSSLTTPTVSSALRTHTNNEEEVTGIIFLFPTSIYHRFSIY